MDQSSQIPSTEVLSAWSGDSIDDKEHLVGSFAHVNREIRENVVDFSLQNDEKFARVDDRSGRAHTTVDLAEIIRRWTHALQRIHKQALQLVRSY